MGPNENGAVSKVMQAWGRHYVRYFNREYRRIDTLWERRFKSSLVQSEHYLLQCQRYIELLTGRRFSSPIMGRPRIDKVSSDST